MIKIVIFLLIFSILVSAGCEQESVPKRDIVLEIAFSNENLLDSPMTRAKELYGRYCSVCHGVTGQGDGFNAFNLTPKPRNFTDSTFIARIDSALIKEAIFGGGAAVGISSLMPKWGKTLTERDIKEITDYIIYLSKHD